MHEATVALAVLKRAVEAVEKRSSIESSVANDDGYTKLEIDRATEQQLTFRVIKITLNVGEFRNIDSESLQFTFSALRKEFALTHHTQLEIRCIPALALCTTANHEFHPEPENCYSCTTCGGGIGKFISGKELDIVNIEIEAKQTESAA